MEPHIFGVTQLNEQVKALLDGDPALSAVFVRGELSNYKLYPSGHHYFTLKDAEGALRCVLFRGSASHLRFRPENGMKVIAFGRVTVFPRDGAYQLYCNDLTPDGVGDLYVAFEQRKAKLAEEGLFDRDHKKLLPRYPETIAVVTSSAGAAIHDMVRILRSRSPRTKVVLLPVRVQGAEAPAEIVGAIRYANRWQVADLIIVGRGGGSMEDLWAFNDERVARAIYESNLPVISAVGHEPDVTIADFVADVRAATPSNAAELAVPEASALLRWLADAAERLETTQTRRLRQLRQRLETLQGKRVLRDQAAYLQDKRMLLAHLQQRLTDVAERTVSRRRAQFSALAAGLDAMSPLKVLGRGYALARTEEGVILKSWKDTTPGARIHVTLGEGALRCAVEETMEQGGADQ